MSRTRPTAPPTGQVGTGQVGTDVDGPVRAGAGA